MKTESIENKHRISGNELCNIGDSVGIGIEEEQNTYAGKAVHTNEKQRGGRVKVANDTVEAKRMAVRASKAAEDKYVPYNEAFYSFIQRVESSIPEKQLLDLADKLEAVVNAAGQGAPVARQEKLTFAEFEQIRGISSICHDLEHYSGDIANLPAYLEKIKYIDGIKKCDREYAKFKEILRREIEESGEGDISVINGSKIAKSDIFADTSKDSSEDVCVDRGYGDLIGVTCGKDKLQERSANPEDVFFRERYAIDPSKLLLKDAEVELEKLGLLKKENIGILREKFHLSKKHIINGSINREITTQHTAFSKFSSLLQKGIRYVKRDSDPWSTALSGAVEGTKIVASPAGFIAMIIVESLNAIDSGMRKQIIVELENIMRLSMQKIAATHRVPPYAAKVEATEAVRREYPTLFKILEDLWNGNEPSRIFSMPFPEGTDFTSMTAEELMLGLGGFGALAQLQTPRIIGEYFIDYSGENHPSAAAV